MVDPGNGVLWGWGGNSHFPGQRKKIKLPSDVYGGEVNSRNTFPKGKIPEAGWACHSVGECFPSTGETKLGVRGEKQDMKSPKMLPER